ncbi:hypothetical protein [Flavobacterium sp.]|uniref:hypothetical protein n=1 Tax=Flavobacterium sp. TaxID=239 RepID=UPI00286E0DCF|nr:hypothetical protein [Flavobacterium sp.]
MKNQFLKITAILVLALAIGCGSDDDGGTIVPVTPPITTPTLQGTVLQGNITSNLNVLSGSYTLKGVVLVKSGVTLTIQPGVTFTVSTADQATGANYLQVEQGGKIIAEGTASSPIVFTAQSAAVGAWGGIIINGKARINVTGGTEIAEAGGLIYGGTDDSDNSGSLKYVRVEYAGAAITGGTAEYNAFSFFGVGSGTILENLQAYNGADDAFEFFGGSVNATNLAAFGCEDDNIDWDRGYRGTLNNIWIKQPTNGDFGFECSNLPVEFNNSPRSNPTVNNVTIVGSGNVTKAAFNFKEGTAGIITNVVVTNAGYGVDLRNQLTQFQDASLKINNANITFLTALTRNGISGNTTDISSIVATSTTSTGANVTPFNNGTWLRN